MDKLFSCTVETESSYLKASIKHWQSEGKGKLTPYSGVKAQYYKQLSTARSLFLIASPDKIKLSLSGWPVFLFQEGYHSQ